MISQPILMSPSAGSLICLSAATVGVAAGRGEVDKDSHHEASVRAAGGIFVPLVVESLGLWSLNIYFEGHCFTYHQ